MELKKPMSYEEQLNRLITHGIVVDDRDRAIDILKRVNYWLFRGNGGLKTSTTPVFIPIRRHSTFG